MPEIPTFVSSQSYQGAGGGQPQTISPSVALQGGNPFEAVARQFAELTDNMQRQQGAIEAAKANSEVSMKLADMQERFANDPDPMTAPKRFQEEMARLQSDALNNMSNPHARSLLQVQLARSAPVAYAHVLRGAVKNQNQLTLANTGQAASDLGKALVGATDEASQMLALDGIRSTWAAAAATGAIAPNQARMGISTTIRDAIAAETNPLKAKALLDKFKGVLDLSHQAALQNHLEAPLRKVEAANYVDRLLGGPAGIRTPPEGLDQEFDRIIGIESNGKQFAAGGGVLTSPKGALGVSQIMPDTARGVAASLGEPLDLDKLKTDEAYNRRFGKEYYRQMRERYGDPTMAAMAYNAGPGRVDEWIQKYGDPRNGDISMQDWVAKTPFEETRNYAAKFGIGDARRQDAGKAPAAISRSDWARMEQQIAKDWAGDPEMRDAAIARLHNRRIQHEALLADDRQAAAKEHDQVIAKLQTGAGDGVDVAALEDTYRVLFPPVIAQGMVDQMKIAKQAGVLGAAIPYASPEQLADIASSVKADPNSPDYKFQLGVENNINQQIAARGKEIAKDPAAYAARSARLQQFAAPLQSNDPAVNTEQARADYYTALLSEQERLGVPKRDQRILSKAQVDEITGKLGSLDLEKQKVGDEFRKLEAAYGSAWPQVYGQLVRDGKLSTGYQFIAGATDAASQDAMQRMMKPGMKSWEEHSTAPAKDVRAAVASALSGFHTIAVKGRGDIGTYNNAATFAEAMTHYYMANGEGLRQAAEHAAKDMFGKWEMSGTMLYPKELGAQPAVATQNVQKSLSANVLQIPEASAATAGVTDKDRGEQYLATVRDKGKWVINGTGSGLVLRIPTFSGALVPVLYANGEPVELLFDSIPMVAGKVWRGQDAWRNNQFPPTQPQGEGRAAGMGWRQ